MPTRFDLDQGILQLRHPALSLLVRLATDPTDPALLDHATAPVLAELRSAGLVGSRGIHPDVAPIAQAIAAADTRWTLTTDDHGAVAVHAVWVGGPLAVVGVAAGDDGTLALMADEPPMLAELLAELVGLGSAGDPGVVGTRALPRPAWDDLVGRGELALPPQVADCLGADPADPWIRALSDGLRGAGVRWRLMAGELDLEILDAGAAGLWAAIGTADDVVQVGLTTAADVRARITAGLP